MILFRTKAKKIIGTGVSSDCTAFEYVGAATVCINGMIDQLKVAMANFVGEADDAAVYAFLFGDVPAIEEDAKARHRKIAFIFHSDRCSNSSLHPILNRAFSKIATARYFSCFYVFRLLSFNDIVTK